MSAGQSRKARKSPLDRVVACPFRTIVANAFPETATVNVVETDLALANLGARAVAIGSAFEFFRMRMLRVYQFTDVVGPVYKSDVTTGTEGHLSAYHALSFIESNAALSGTASSVVQMSQYELFAAGGTREKLKVAASHRQLQANAYKWFNTASTGASTDDLSPGLVVSLVSNDRSVLSGWTGTAFTVIEGIVEFRGMITPALSYAGIPASADDVLSLSSGMNNSPEATSSGIPRGGSAKSLAGSSQVPALRGDATRRR